MNKNIIWILLIFLVPIGLYFGLTRDQITTQPAVAAGDELLKFASPMCSECIELQKVLDAVMPKYNNITLRKYDITKKDKNCQALIEEYDIRLVPTTIFKNQDGRVLRRVEGAMQPEELESYLAELSNE